MQAIALALACLSFDFFGTCMDDSSEDLSTIQVRHRQRPGCPAGRPRLVGMCAASSQ